jgi:hypothetical protein
MNRLGQSHFALAIMACVLLFYSVAVVLEKWLYRNELTSASEQGGEQRRGSRKEEEKKEEFGGKGKEENKEGEMEDQQKESTWCCTGSKRLQCVVSCFWCFNWCFKLVTRAKEAFDAWFSYETGYFFLL